MTTEEGEYYITLAMLHGPSTIDEVKSRITATHDPLNRTLAGTWWVYRDAICGQDFDTQAEAAYHYCEHYGLLQEVTDDRTRA
jgi:hypothetical protein